MRLAPLCAALALCAGFSAHAASNVALLGAASQSSYWGSESDYTRASNAIDGNTDGDYYHKSIQHTNEDFGLPVGNGFAWWQVALDQDYLIDSITIWNRTDCCTARLKEFTVSIFNDDSLVWSGSYDEDNGPLPSTSFAGIATIGDTVFVQLDRRDYLHMAEVQVFAGPVPEPETYALMLAGLAIVGAVARRRAN